MRTRVIHYVSCALTYLHYKIKYHNFSITYESKILINKLQNITTVALIWFRFNNKISPFGFTNDLITEIETKFLVLEQNTNSKCTGGINKI